MQFGRTEAARLSYEERAKSGYEVIRWFLIVHIALAITVLMSLVTTARAPTR